ncbi:MAG: hypothetical protein WC887_00715 [Candidatus Paceibacterota bacterium]
MIENTELGERTGIEKNVMRRVRLIRILGLIISTLVLALITFVLALWGIGKQVWVDRVLTNGPQDFTGHALYLVYAFAHTRFLVQILALLSFVAFLYIIRETYKALVSFFTHSHT